MSHSNGHSARFNSDSEVISALPRRDPPEEGSYHTQPRDPKRKQDLENNDTSMPREWERISSLAIKHLQRCISLEPKALQGNDPGAIHDLRVATRRLQQVIDLIYPSPRAGEVRKLYRGLRRCRRSLSEVRNYDVLLKRVQEILARKRTARREAWEVIGEYLKELRAARLEKSLRKLAKANLSDIYIRLKEHLPAKGGSEYKDGITNSNGGRQDLTLGQFYQRISDALSSAWAEFEKEVAQSRHDHSPAVLHRTRIAAKRVRYLIEVIQAFDVPGSKEALIWLRSLQGQLGDWHDLVVFEDAVIAMIGDRDFLREHLEMAIQIERLILRNRALKAKLEMKYFEMVREKTAFTRTQEWVRRMVDSPAAQFAGV
jgi:CHAD domain-containing protein